MSGPSCHQCGRSHNDLVMWLIFCPASDINFRMNLRNANKRHLRIALQHELSKSAKKALEARLRRLEKKK